MTTTAIDITYLTDDGRRVPMGTGTIDAQGQITITSPAAGQEDYIATEMKELNARAYVILKEPPAEDMPRFSIGKRKVYRGNPEFLSALKDYGMRVYSMEFDFDIAAIQPPPQDMDSIEAEDLRAQEPDVSPLEPVGEDLDIETGEKERAEPKA